MTPKKDAKFCEHTPTPSPCTQQPTINKMDEKLDKVIEALQTLAAQGVTINYLTEQLADTRKWVKDIQQDVNSLKLAPGSIASRVLWVIASGIITIACGITVYAVTHIGT